MKKESAFRKLTLVFLMFTFWLKSQAQAPGGVPYGDPKPVEFDLVNTIIFIVVPILLIAFFFWYRRRRRKK